LPIFGRLLRFATTISTNLVALRLDKLLIVAVLDFRWRVLHFFYYLLKYLGIIQIGLKTLVDLLRFLAIDRRLLRCSLTWCRELLC
jgi:hypothetical protein